MPASSQPAPRSALPVPRLRCTHNPAGLRALIARHCARWAPPPRLKISEWAERYAYLPAGNAEPGKLRIDRLPYQREALDDPLDPTVSETVYMVARQLWKTTNFTITNGYFIDQDPAPILNVYPALGDAETFMKEKLVPFIEATPRLKAKIAPHKSRTAGNTILHKSFPGGNVSACGANSPSSLRQRSKRIILCDEIDSMRPNAEGDPIAQAVGRAETYHNAVLMFASTPTIKGLSRIERKYDQSDKQLWFCPCPKCGVFQTLKWGQVKFSFERADGTKYRDTKATVYVCENEACAAHWSDADRIAAINAGQWRATAPFTGIRGRHLNGLYRILGKKRAFESYLHQFAEGFLEAHRGGRFSLIVWTNTFLAETWEENIERLNAGVFESRRENYTPLNLPDDVLVLTAGIDVQSDRVEVEVKGWGRAYESWGVTYRVIPGNPFQPQLYKDLDDFLVNFAAKTADGRRLKIAAACIDSGFATDHVCAYAKSRFHRRVFAVKGSNQPGQPLIGGLSRANRRKCPIYRLGTDTAKSELYGHLRLDQPGPGYCHWPIGGDLNFEARYFAGLTAEEMTVQYVKGFPRRAWILPDGRWNEPLDVNVYARAAVAILQPNWDALARNAELHRLSSGSSLAKPADAAQNPASNDPPPDPVVKPPAPPRRPARPARSGFVKGWR